MEKRWLSYTGIGLVFGIIDWYFLQFLAAFPATLFSNEGEPPALLRLLMVAAIVGLNYGIWLIPAIPAALIEYKQSKSLLWAGASAVIVWSAALFSYYVLYGIILMFSGLPNLDFMLLSNRQIPGYWTDWWPPFRQLIVFQFLEWIGIAIVGGFIIGGFSALIYRAIARRRLSRQHRHKIPD